MNGKEREDEEEECSKENSQTEGERDLSESQTILCPLLPQGLCTLSFLLLTEFKPLASLLALHLGSFFIIPIQALM